MKQKRKYHFKFRGKFIEVNAKNLDEAYDYIYAIHSDATKEEIDSAYRTY